MPDSRYRLLTARIQDGVLVLTVTRSHLRSTEFDLVDVLREEMLRALAESKSTQVVVDLSAVEQVGSASFRPLLSLRRRLHEKNGTLMLSGLQPDVREVFLVTRLVDNEGSLDATFGAAPDVNSAVARLRNKS
jgi:anti-anti-sigma factor